MKKLPLSLGLGMIISLALGLLGVFSFSGRSYMATGAAVSFNMDWGALALNIVAWVVITYAILFVYEKIRK